MTNDEMQMTKEIRISKHEGRRIKPFELRFSSLFRHSDFDIRHSATDTGFSAATAAWLWRVGPRATPIQPSSITNCVIATLARFGLSRNRCGVTFQALLLGKALENTPRNAIWPPPLIRWPES